MGMIMTRMRLRYSGENEGHKTTKNKKKVFQKYSPVIKVLKNISRFINWEHSLDYINDNHYHSQ